MPDRPEIVCICGSTRFADEMRAANRDLTFAGAIVVAPGEADELITNEQKTALDALHLRKIDHGGLCNRYRGCCLGVPMAVASSAPAVPSISTPCTGSFMDDGGGVARLRHCNGNSDQIWLGPNAPGSPDSFTVLNNNGGYLCTFGGVGTLGTVVSKTACSTYHSTWKWEPTP